MQQHHSATSSLTPVPVPTRKWDKDGRVWLYNSDDGTVHFYSVESGSWQHTIYGPVGNPRETGQPEPPDGLFPGYVHAQEQ